MPFYFKSLVDCQNMCDDDQPKCIAHTSIKYGDWFQCARFEQGETHELIQVPSAITGTPLSLTNCKLDVVFSFFLLCSFTSVAHYFDALF